MIDESIFAAALDKADPAARAKFLAEACGTDAELRRRVEGLLAAHESAGSFLAQPAVSPPDAEHAATRVHIPTPDPDADSTRTGAGPRAADDDEALGFLAPSKRPDSLGRLGHYEVLEVLGKGGFGIVFRAFDDKLQRVVAVKMLSPQMAATSPARKRFLREAQSSARLRHENVVWIHATEEAPLPFLVMEFVPGETLQQRLDRTGPLDVPDVLRIGRQIAEGLAAAHATDLIHRDVKPSNVMIESGPHGRVKLTDFGLARAADDASISQSGVVAGTPMYMAPEQAKGDALDHRADLFSLGSVFYTMLTGRPPFRANTTVAVLKRVVDDTPRPIREVIPEVPQWLCRIVEKLHAKNPAERFQSAREVADVLADCETQMKQHGALRDFSRVPGGGPRVRLRLRKLWKWAAAALVLACIAILCIGPRNTWRFVTGETLVEFVAQDEVSAIAFHRDNGEVYTWHRDPADPGYTWGKIELPPGRYTVRTTVDPGQMVYSYDATSGGFFSNQGQYGVSEIINLGIERGDRVYLEVRLYHEPDVPKPTLPETGWTPLFNGKDLTGWEADRPQAWRVENGIVIGDQSAGPTSLATARGDFTNFHLRFEAIPANEIVINSRSLPGAPGYSISYSSGNCVASWPGNLPGLAFTPGQKTVKPENWFVGEVIADGPTITFKVNGTPCVHIKDAAIRPGRIEVRGSPAYFGRSRVYFRKIEIKELPPSPAAPNPVVVQALRDAVEAKERSRDTVRVRVGEGAASKLVLLAAEVELTEARINLAEAQQDQPALAAPLQELVAYRQEERDLIAVRVKEGLDRPDVLNPADARLADAKARLAKSRPSTAPEVAPPPRLRP